MHFKFDRFATERDYDYFHIGYRRWQDGFEPGLILDGNQQTDIWVNADSIPDFNIYFERKALNLN